MYLSNYLGMLRQAETDLADGFRRMAEGHAKEPDIYFLCHTLDKQCDEHGESLEPFGERYGDVPPRNPTV